MDTKKFDPKITPQHRSIAWGTLHCIARKGDVTAVYSNKLKTQQQQQ